jgi:hypothetical protein
LTAAESVIAHTCFLLYCSGHGRWKTSSSGRIRTTPPQLDGLGVAGERHAQGRRLRS